MSIQAWHEIKQRKFFYVHGFRAASTALFVSLCLNVVLGLGVYFAYLWQPDREFYSTNGITQPVKLMPRLAPNESSQALLAPDQEISNETQKVIPQ